jgi:hypothetical protein
LLEATAANKYQVLFDNSTIIECFSNSLCGKGASSSIPPDIPPHPTCDNILTHLKNNVKRRQNGNLRLTFKSRKRRSIYQLQYLMPQMGMLSKSKKIR